MDSLPPSRPRGKPAPSPSTLVIRNVVVAGHRTSVRLEPVMWEALRDIAERQQQTIHEVVTEINRQRTASSLTAAIRVYIVDFYRGSQSGQRAAQGGPNRGERRDWPV